MSDVIKLYAKSRTVKVKVDGESVGDDPEQSRERDEQRHKEELRRQYDKGFNEGQHSVKAQYENYYTEKLLERYDDIHKIFSQFDQKILKYDNLFEKLAVETAFVIAEKIVKTTLERESNIISLLQDSLKRVLGANDVSVKINPEDYAKLFSKENDVTLDDSFAKIRFEKDERIEAGGCLVETEIGNVDARVSSRFAELKKHMDLNMLPPSEE